MGYQEAFIHTTCSNIERNNKEIAKYIEIFKKYDVRCEGDWLASCICKLHFNKTVSKFKKGMDVLIISGERQALRYAERVFDCDYEYGERDMTQHYTEEEMKLIKRARITFIEEECGVLDVLNKDCTNEDYITKEYFTLKPDNLPSNFNEVQSIANSICGKIFEWSKSQGRDPRSIYSCRPCNEEEEEFIIGVFKQEFGKKGYEVKVVESEEKIHTGSIRKDKIIYVNDIKVASCSYLSWSDQYSLNLFNLAGQELRWLCEKLLKEAIK